MRDSFRWLVVGLVLVISTFSESQATHIRAGEITVERTSCQSLNFRITITGWVDLESTVEFGGGYLDFGDGSQPVNLRDMAIIIVDKQDLGGNVGVTQFQIEHTYGANGIYTLSYLEANRNAGILNMQNSVETTFYIETQLIIDPFLGCNNTPILLIPPIDEACSGATFFHNPGAFDADGDSISYELTIPKRDEGTTVNGYQYPNDRAFGGSREDSNLDATFDIDAVTGDISWDAPGVAGEYNIAFIVREWRIIQGRAFMMSFITRDMQIIVEDCDNERPELQIPEDVCVEAGTLIEEVIIGTDPDDDRVKLEAYGGPFEVPSSPAEFKPFPPEFQSQPAYDTIRWQTNCTHVRNQPYQITFKITDEPLEGPKLVGFEPWSVTVVAPAPEGIELTVNPSRTIGLTWDQYFCQNARAIQIWRRVDSYDFDTEECVTGIPEYAGYELIEEVRPDVTSYLDDNGGKFLDFGALYCYRIVAVFPDPAGGESYASVEVCGIIEATAPVITNVTIDATDDEEGKITVKWTKPFNIDQTLFPPPYIYALFRVRGINAEEAKKLNSDTVLVAAAIPELDTVFVNDKIDTEDEVYHFFIVLSDLSARQIIVSSSASSVEVEPKPLFKEIELRWQADVPWSNNTQNFPMHYVYRDNVNSDDKELVLIDSVNVNTDNFLYVDAGQFNNTTLNERTLYCYYIVTQGSYGNDEIFEPLINLSHIVCAQPNDTIPPCAPVLEVEVTDCETFFSDKSCSFSDYQNRLIWRKDDDCPEDEEEVIKSYNIYYSRSGETDDFTLINNVESEEFIHSNIPSFAGCYYVTAVDRSGNESLPSNIECNDNCPNYDLPNVFTPNGDGYNDFFTALNPVDNSSEGNPDTDYDPVTCPRFVDKVTFRVFNRGGKEIYTFESGGENSILIEWDGRTNDGQQLPSGVYYFIAEVEFDMIDPARRKEVIKSWVQILK